MKRLKMTMAFLFWIMLMVAQPGRSWSSRHGSIVIVTRALAGRNINVAKALAMLNQVTGPRHLPYVPREMFPQALFVPYLRFNHADLTGLFWDRYDLETPGLPVPGAPVHFVRRPGVFFRWKDAWLIVRLNNGSLLVYGRNNATLSKGGSISPLEIPIASAPGREEQDILPTVFKLCPNVQNPHWNGSAGAGRIYFYRGREFVGSAAPIGVSANGMVIGYLPGGNSYFYIDEPAGNYKIGWRLGNHYDYKFSPLGNFGSVIGSNAIRFTHAIAFTESRII